MTQNRSPSSTATIVSALLLVSVPLAACDREDRAEVDEALEEAAQQLDEAAAEAEPVVEEGLREVGEAVGTGVEAAGEVIQHGGEELQEQTRDTTATTLPDTVSDSTMVLQ